MNASKKTTLSFFKKTIASFFVLFSASALAGTTICNGSLIAGTYDNVRVAEGASCSLNAGVVINNNFSAANGADINLDGIIIKGSVSIDNSKGSSFYIKNSIINKNVSITNCQYKTNMNINSSQIGGSVNIDNNMVNLESNPPFPGTFDNSIALSVGSIGGNLSIQGNKAFHQVIVDGTSIKGNVLMYNNHSTANLVAFAGTVGGNLSVLNNRGGGSTDYGSSPLAIAVVFSDVIGNVDVSGNVGLNNSLIDIEFVTVGKNITCNKNNPTPTTGYFGGGGPVVAGNNNCVLGN